MINTRRLSALALVFMMMMILADALVPAAPWRWAARSLLLGYGVMEWPRMAGNARIMVAVAAAMSLTYGLMEPSPWSALAQAFDHATFFATFFANQFFLREAARTSPLVRRCSSLFIDQSPSRRYALLTIGGYLFGIIVNLGVLSLLGQMIAKRNTLAAAGGDEAVHRLRLRRMVLALLRGFSVTPLGSPLSLSLAVVLTALPGLHWGSMVGLGLGSAALILAAGYVQDRLAAPRALAGRVPVWQGRHDYAALLGIVAIVLSVLALAKSLEALAAIPPSRAILVALPVVGLVWLARHYARFPVRRQVPLLARRISRRAASSFPAYRSEVSILASAGFVGSLFSAFVPPELLSHILTAHMVPTIALPACLLLVVVAAGLVGINPIVVVTIGASTLRVAPDLGIPLELMALALMMGWSMAINSSALTASAMLLADIVGERKPGTLIRWNAGFAAVTLAMLCVLLALAAAWGAS